MMQYQRTVRLASVVALLLFSTIATFAQSESDTPTPTKPLKPEKQAQPRDMFEQMQLQMQQMMQQFNSMGMGRGFQQFGFGDDSDSSLQKGYTFKMDTTFDLGNGMGQGGFQSFRYFNDGNGWKTMPSDSSEQINPFDGLGNGNSAQMQEMMKRLQQMMPNQPDFNAPDNTDPNADRPAQPKRKKGQKGQDADKKTAKKYETESL